MRILHSIKDKKNYVQYFYTTMSLVGTGASCVYPLLAATLNGWQFIATDADATNVDYATANVLQNNLTDKIKGKYLDS